MDMKINSISNIQYTRLPSKTSATKPSARADNLTHITFTSTALFKRQSARYINAREYLNFEKKLKNGFDNVEIYDLNLNLLDGIQEGIKVFKGLNMKEIAFIGQTITEVAVKRGCYNNCSHCYAGGMPPIREDSEHINKMSWNDFTALTDGFKELNKRLGFSITKSHKKNYIPYITSFHDADSIDIVLKDNKGISHDFTDISEKLSEAFDIKSIFDTAGWNPKNTATQMRAEKYAKYYENPKNASKLHQFNLSVNPYHSIHTREVLFDRMGETEKAEKFRKLYIDRMANVLYTFTPLIESGKLTFLARSAANYSKVDRGFQERGLRFLYDEIFEALSEKYKEDFLGQQHFIKDLSKIKKIINSCRMKMEHINTSMCITDRLTKLYASGDTEVSNCNRIRKSDIKRINNAKTINDILINNRGYLKYAGLLDSNGHYYLTDFCLTFPTELQLNFENKNKKTAPIEPYLQTDTIITRRLINSCK